MVSKHPASSICMALSLIPYTSEGGAWLTPLEAQLAKLPRDIQRLDYNQTELHPSWKHR